ncbi:MAG TPA: hypothetical protein PKM65_04120 [Spirochaetota bacterium]|nr:hypothetical protein [Spirochaetota bacterium]HNT10731.1 hypothetical protein [Spirochaetota bacterium]
MRITINIDINDRIISILKTIIARRYLIVWLSLAISISSIAVLAITLTKPHTFTPGNVIFSDDVNENFDILYAGVNSIKEPPIGSIIAWHKSMAGTPAIPGGWVECNGQVVSDADSPYNGTAVPALNSDAGSGQGGRFLRGNSASGIMQSDDFKSHTHQIRDESDPSGGGALEEGSWSGAWLNGLVSETGGPETRPANMSVVWIIRVK